MYIYKSSLLFKEPKLNVTIVNSPHNLKAFIFLIKIDAFFDTDRDLYYIHAYLNTFKLYMHIYFWVSPRFHLYLYKILNSDLHVLSTLIFKIEQTWKFN